MSEIGTVWAFDIETTGLLPKKPTIDDMKTRHTLIGIASRHGIHQFCAHNLEDEKMAVSQFREMMQKIGRANV